MVIDDLVDIGMEVWLLFDAFIDLPEKRLVDELLKTTDGEMGDEVLTITQIAKAVEGVEKVGFEVVEGLGLVIHTHPKHPRRMFTAKDTGAVEVHGERMVPLGHRLTGLNDLGDVVVGGVAHKFQGKVDLVRFAPVDVTTFVFKVALQTLHQRRILLPYGNRNR